MPVPKSNIGTVQQRALPNQRLTTDAPAAAFGGGQPVFDAAQKFIAQEQENADQLVTTEVFAKLKQAKNDLIFNPDTGLMNRKGKEAFGAPDEFLPQFDKNVEDITKDLSQRQQAKVQRLVMTERVDFDETLNKHMTRERITYDEESTKSGLMAAQDEAIKNYDNNDKIINSLDSQAALIQAQAKRNGLGDDWVRTQTAQLASKTHSGVISRQLANGEDLRATQYYNDNKAFFSGEDAIKIEKELEVGSLRGSSQRLSDLIVSKSKSLSDALTEVKKIEDPKVRDATLERVKGEFSLKDAAKRDREESDFLSATNILEKGGSYDSIPPAIIARMPLSQRSSLRSYMSNKESDPSTYYELKTMAATPATREKFLNTNLLDYVGSLSRSDFKELTGDQASMLKGDSQTEEKLDGFLSDKQAIDSVAVSAGIMPGRFASDETKNTYNSFLAAVNKEQIKLQKDNKRKATSEEVRAIADQFIIKGITEKGFLFDSKKMLFESNDNEDFGIELEDIPKAEFKKIRDFLKSRNMVDSDTSILELYRKKLKGMRSGK